MTKAPLDPAVEWARHLARLPGPLQHAVADVLRRSAADGHPAPEDEVTLLVSYALGEISARDHVRGVLRSFGHDDVPALSDVSDAGPDEQSVGPVDAPRPEAAEARQVRQVQREDAVQAYVTGEIPVSEFLRIARG
jgi:hypothetical protein